MPVQEQSPLGGSHPFLLSVQRDTRSDWTFLESLPWGFPSLPCRCWSCSRSFVRGHWWLTNERAGRLLLYTCSSEKGTDANEFCCPRAEHVKLEMGHPEPFAVLGPQVGSATPRARLCGTQQRAVRSFAIIFQMWINLNSLFFSWPLPHKLS